MTEIREALSEAFSSAKEAPEPVEIAPVENSTAAPEVDSSNSPDEPVAAAAKSDGRDEKGRFASKAKDAAPPAVSAKAPPVVAPAPAAVVTEGVKPAPVVAPTEALKPPQSWKPAAREKWAALPPEVQQEAVRLDREIRTTMQETAAARKTAEEFQRTVAPFEAMIRAEGSDPVKAVGNLLQTAAALRTAPPAHKAQLVAQLVKTYGIPIDALDAALSGEAIPQPAQQQGQFRDPRFDQFLQTLEQRKAQAAQAEAQRVASEMEKFAAEAEFFDDVREDMADLIEAKARRGVELTPKQAYDLACSMHPEISGVISQRQAAASAANAQASTQRARNAASSVKSQPAGPSQAGEPDDIRGALKAALAQSR